MVRYWYGEQKYGEIQVYRKIAMVRDWHKGSTDLV